MYDFAQTQYSMNYIQIAMQDIYLITDFDLLRVFIYMGIFWFIQTKILKQRLDKWF